MNRFLKQLVVVLVLAAAPVLSQEPNAPAPREQQNFLKVVPADALVVVITNQDKFAKRLDELQKEIGFRNFGITGEAALSMIHGYLGANSGVDTGSSLIGVILDPKANDTESVVFGIPIKDAKELLSNYDLKPADVADGNIAEINTNFGWNRKQPNYVVIHGNHMWTSPTRDVLEKAIKLESLHERLNPVRRAELADVGVMIHIGAKLLDDKDKERTAKNLVEMFGGSEAGKHALTVVQHLHSAQLTISSKKDFKIGLQINLDGNPDAEDSLSLLLGEGQSDIIGLPDGNLLVAGALHGTADGTATVMGDMNWHWFLGSNVSAVHSSAIAGLLGDLAAHIDNTSVGWYLNEKPEDHGAMSVVSILDPAETPEKLIAELKSLSTFVNARAARDLRIQNQTVDGEEIARLIKQLPSRSIQERRSAASKLRLIGSAALPALDKAAESERQTLAREASRVARSIRSAEASQNRRVIQNGLLSNLKPQFLFRKNGRDPKRPIVEVLLKPGPATTKLNRQMTGLFGPEWKRFRLAILEDHVVVLLGSDMGLLDRTVAQVQRGAIPKAMENTVKAARNNFKGQRLGEWHFSLPGISKIANGELETPGEQGLYSTVTFLKRKAQIRTDIHFPLSELKALWAAEEARRNR